MDHALSGYNTILVDGYFSVNGSPWDRGGTPPVPSERKESVMKRTLFCILTMVVLCIVSVADADELYTSITEMRTSAGERLCEVYALCRNYFTKACRKPWIGLS